MSKLIVLQYPVVSLYNSFSGFCYGLWNQLLLKTRYKLVYDQRILIRHVHTTIDSGLVHTIIYDHTWYFNMLNCVRYCQKKKLFLCFFFFGLNWFWYQAGVLRFSFWFMSSPVYLSELFEYLYVGGKYIFPSFHPTNTWPCLCSILSCLWQVTILAYIGTLVGSYQLRTVKFEKSSNNCRGWENYTWSFSNNAFQLRISTSAFTDRYERAIR